jgi:hypothetical protein
VWLKRQRTFFASTKPCGQTPVPPKKYIYIMMIPNTYSKAFDIIQNLFMIKILNKLVTEEMYLTIIKSMCYKPTTISYSAIKNLKAFL